MPGASFAVEVYARARSPRSTLLGSLTGVRADLGDWLVGK